jgi:hypothetical protein
MSSSLSIESYQGTKKKKICPGYRKFSAYDPVALQEFTHNLFENKNEIACKPIITNDAQTPDIACFISVLTI